MDIVRKLDEHLWRKFVQNHPDSRIFHTPEMFQVFARTEGYRPTLWAAVEKDDRVLALLLPVEITLMHGWARRFTSRAVAYGSVLCAAGDPGQQALGALLQAYQREIKGRLMFTELRNLSDLTDLQPTLNSSGFIHEEHLNYLLDLKRTPDEIWQSIRSNARRNINKARKSQVVIEPVNCAEQVSLAYGLLRDTYQRLRVPLAHATLFQSAFEILSPPGLLRILVAKLKDTPIGVMTLLLHKDIVHYWYTGILREYASFRPNDLLVWHALEWGSQNGFSVFDFGGAGKPDEEYGVRDFKAKFGGRLVNYGRNVCVHSPLILKASTTIYQGVRRFLYKETLAPKSDPGEAKTP